MTVNGIDDPSTTQLGSHEPVLYGRTRELTSRERAGLDRARRSDPWLFVIGVALFWGAAAFLTWATAPSTPGEAPAGTPEHILTGTFWGFGALTGLSYFYRPRQPSGPPARVGRYRGIVRVSGRPARTTIGGVPVIIPLPWHGRLPLDTLVDVEVTPPVDATEGWVRRNRVRQVVSAYDGRLWVGDLATSRSTERVEPDPAIDEAAVARARTLGARPLTSPERAAAATMVARDYGAIVSILLPALGACAVCVWGAVATWPTWRAGGILVAAAATFFAFVAAWVGRDTLRAHWLGRASDFTSAGRLQGRVVVQGAPPRTYVAGVRVALPTLQRLRDGTDVDIEVTPAFADDPRATRPRVVVGGA